jgi:hypothetical protein
MNNIPKKTFIGIFIFVVLYVFSVLAYINNPAYHYFFVLILIGLSVVIFNLLYGVSKFYTLQEQAIIASNNPVSKIITCPEYWKKTVLKDDIQCSSNSIYGNKSFADINQVNNDQGNSYKTLKYKNISLNSINADNKNHICANMFAAYNDDDTKLDTIENKNNITWMEYQNKCNIQHV